MINMFNCEFTLVGNKIAVQKIVQFLRLPWWLTRAEVAF
jgi:hypothetical protein